MPELPEVEVVKRSLEKKIKNLTIKKVKINDSNLRYKISKKILSKIIGKKIKKVERRSKFLIFDINENFHLLVHLGMTGKFFYINKRKEIFKTSFYYSLENNNEKHNRVEFFFKNKKKLIYNDVRKFGFIKLYNFNEVSDSLHLKNLGPEPLGKNYNFNYLKKFISGRKRTIKSILMDQKCVSGLGNIYVNEILFLSRVKPNRRVSTLKDNELKSLVKNTKKILKSSIKLGGSSIKDFSSDDGIRGSYQQHFNVYGRNEGKCSNTDCNTSIIRTVISNRATFFCKRCQK